MNLCIRFLAGNHSLVFLLCASTNLCVILESDEHSLNKNSRAVWETSSDETLASAVRQGDI
jgi:hypothetical protein